MSSIEEKIDITPHKSLYAKLGQTGYSVGEAIAELVDNAIDARQDERAVTIKITMNKKENKIIIEDDAKGMDKKTASQSIVLGFSNKQAGQLGEFGLGLKTACSSLGKKFTVNTTPYGSNEGYRIIFDEDEFEQKGEWKEFSIIIEKGFNAQEGGTKIVIEKLKFNFHNIILQKVEEQLSERFAPFIANGEARISINNKWLKKETLGLVGRKRPLEIKLSNG
ncbi:MAG TPA: ATP-binding protein, partial [Candidatus Pacearchaeota archaeon]|nr:ATP-binding protein [Candidatus Pacearchaeota archaeon]